MWKHRMNEFLLSGKGKLSLNHYCKKEKWQRKNKLIEQCASTRVRKTIKWKITEIWRSLLLNLCLKSLEVSTGRNLVKVNVTLKVKMSCKCDLFITYTKIEQRGEKQYHNALHAGCSLLVSPSSTKPIHLFLHLKIMIYCLITVVEQCKLC